MDLQLSGKRAVVTGGSRGIGRAIANVLARECCEVVVCARNEEALVEAAAEIASETGSTSSSTSAEPSSPPALPI